MNCIIALGAWLLGAVAQAQTRPEPTLTGAAALGDWRSDAPGVLRRITEAELPPPYASRFALNFPSVVAEPQDAALQVPRGFTVGKFAAGLRNPRIIRVAPNGDIFVAETAAGRIRVLRAADGAAQPQIQQIFAADLDRPFGIAFYPPGPRAALRLCRDQQRSAPLRLSRR